MNEYASLSLAAILFDLPLAAGLQLLEARACRLAPDRTIGFVEREIIRARAAVRTFYEAEFTILPTPPRRQATTL